MDERLILAVDIGSSNIKALLVASDGLVVASASEELRELYPDTNQVEQAPKEIWEGFCAATRRVVADAGGDAARIAGLVLDSNRCGLMLADEDFEPLTNIMTWRDSRSGPCVSDFSVAYPEIDLYAVTGEEGLPQHSLFKALWCQKYLPQVWAQCRYLFLSPKDYVLYRLLGRFVTSRSMAQSTGLFNIRTLEYSDAVLKAAGIEKRQLPRLYHSNEVVGALPGATAKMLGLGQGLPVMAGLCDATASQLGSGSVRPGLFTISIGTCGAVRTFSEKPAFASNRFTQVRVVSPFGYVPSCTVSDAGSVLKWYRNNFHLAGQDAYKQIDQMSARVPAGSQGLLLLPYFTGSSYAVKDSSAFGMFAGIRNFHTAAHFSRAIMEGVAYSLRAVLDSFIAEGFAVDEVRLGGGGASSPLWTQIMADVLNVPLRIPACSEASAMGSAIMAAVGLGIHQDLTTAVEAMVHFNGSFVPNAQNEDVYRKGYLLFGALLDGTRDFHKLYSTLADLAEE